MKFSDIWKLIDNYPGYFFPREAEALYNALLLVTEKGVVVELGSLFGKSSVIIGEVSKENKYDFYCIDAFVTDGEDAKAHFVENVKNVYKACTLIEKTTHEASKTWKKPIDLLFIDANHQDDGILEDCTDWLPFVKKGGIVAWHDYNNDSFPNVKKRVEEFTSDWEIIANNQDSIMIKRKPKK